MYNIWSDLKRLLLCFNCITGEVVAEVLVGPINRAITRHFVARAALLVTFWCQKVVTTLNT
jgi:hypothetical protein